jgi:hypothetical protein
VDSICQNAAFTVYKSCHTRMRRSDFKDGLLIYFSGRARIRLYRGSCVPHIPDFFLRKTTHRHIYIYPRLWQIPWILCRSPWFVAVFDVFTFTGPASMGLGGDDQVSLLQCGW